MIQVTIIWRKTDEFKQMNNLNNMRTLGGGDGEMLKVWYLD